MALPVIKTPGANRSTLLNTGTSVNANWCEANTVRIPIIVKVTPRPSPKANIANKPNASFPVLIAKIKVAMDAEQGIF